MSLEPNRTPIVSEDTANHRSERLVNFTLTEIMVLVVFVFLIVVAGVTQELESNQQELDMLRNQNSDVVQYRNLIETLFDKIGSPLPDNWDRLVSEERFDSYLARRKDLLAELEEELASFKRQISELQASLTREQAQNARLLEVLNNQSPSAAQTERRLEQMEARITEKDREISSLKRELVNKQDQLAWAQQQRERDGRRSISVTPCWFREDGRSIEYLMTVELLDSGLRLRNELPAQRLQDARKLGLTGSDYGRTLTIRQFSRLAAPIFRISTRGGDPENPSSNFTCRFFVKVVDRANSKAAYKQGLDAIQRYFYILEVSE